MYDTFLTFLLIKAHIFSAQVPREVPGANASLFQHKELEWGDFYLLWKKKPHMKNILKNGSADGIRAQNAL